MLTTGDASLYFHIPFCKKKCPYCHFYVIPYQEDLREKLFQGLALEWAHHQEKLQGKKIISVYFGGGTPSLFGAEYIKKILSWISLSSECEITLEANPEEITHTLMQSYKEAGVNRVSMGIQSLSQKELTLLGRNNTPPQALSALRTTYEADIDNISIDLMYDVPSQTLESWRTTLSYLKDLPLSHISLYNLTFEPHTLFSKKKKELEPLLPNPEESLELLHTAFNELKNLGFHQYEISAFAKKGCESRHNTGYWTGRPFLGFGPSAFSFWNRSRFQNKPHFTKYLDALHQGLSPIDFHETLSEEASLHELLAIGLRRLEGVELSSFPVLPEVYSSLLSKGWISIQNGRACLTSQGLLFYDSVAEEIIRPLQ